MNFYNKNNIIGITKRYYSVILAVLTLFISINIVACGSGSSSGGDGIQGSGSLRINLRDESMKCFSQKSQTVAKEYYINRLVVDFYEALSDDSAGDFLFTRDIAVSKNQDSVYIDGIPAPRRYLFVVNIYYDGDSVPSYSPQYLADVQVGKTAKAIPTNIALRISGSPKISVGSTAEYHLFATFGKNEKEYGDKAIWTIDDSDSASLVVESGVAKVTAKAVGVVNLVAMTEGATPARFAISMENSGVDDLYIEGDSGLIVGSGVGIYQLMVGSENDEKAVPYEGRVSWSLTPEKIASLYNNNDQTASVTPLSPGKITLIAVADDGRSASLDVFLSSYEILGSDSVLIGGISQEYEVALRISDREYSSYLGNVDWEIVTLSGPSGVPLADFEVVDDNKILVTGSYEGSAELHAILENGEKLSKTIEILSAI